MIRRRGKDSIRDKIGSMLMFGFRGTSSLDNGVEEMIRDIGAYQLGSVVLYAYNIESAQQLQGLTSSLRHANPCLLVSVDQEGGRVQRLNAQKGFESTESAKHISSNYGTEGAYEKYDIMGNMLASMGINFNIGPCVDIDKSPPCSVIGGLERSYSEDPNIVVQYAKQFILAHEKNAVLTALKHFPGHGFATGDTHKGLVDVTDSANPDIELAPYRELLAGATHTAVMSAHVVNRKLDPEGLPATLSSKIINILRETLNFQGVVVTDALEMGAIRAHYTLEEVVIKAINAGNDILLFSRNAAASPDSVEDESWNTSPGKIIDIIERAIASGSITSDRIDESYNRMTAFTNLICGEVFPVPDDLCGEIQV